jgi:F-type H+-transporting ATPase subunit epsilon
MAEISDKTIRVELITPEGCLFADEARMVVVPGAAGEVGVLPRHMPLTARLKPGETRIQRGGDDWLSFATSEGFFTVGADLAVVLVEHAEAASEINVSAAQSELEAARGRLSEAEASGDERSADVDMARRDVLYAESKLKVAGKD